MTVKELLSLNIKRLRTEKGLSQMELSELTGVKPSALRETEQGVSSLQWERVVQLADGLGVSLEEFRRPVNPEDVLTAMSPRNRKKPSPE